MLIDPREASSVVSARIHMCCNSVVGVLVAGGRRHDSANPARARSPHLRLHALQETGPVPSTLGLHGSPSLKPKLGEKFPFIFCFLCCSAFSLIL